MLLREGLDALGDSEPRLALQMVFRLCWALIYSDDADTLAGLVSRAGELDRRLADTESHVLAALTGMEAVFAHSLDPYAIWDRLDDILELIPADQRSGREDLLFRVVVWSAFGHYARGRRAECERAIEIAAHIAERLGSPRFTWEVDAFRGFLGWWITAIGRAARRSSAAQGRSFVACARTSTSTSS